MMLLFLRTIVDVTPLALAVLRVLQGDESAEDISDEAYVERHRKQEEVEKKERQKFRRSAIVRLLCDTATAFPLCTFSMCILLTFPCIRSDLRSSLSPYL